MKATEVKTARTRMLSELKDNRAGAVQPPVPARHRPAREHRAAEAGEA